MFDHSLVDKFARIGGVIVNGNRINFYSTWHPGDIIVYENSGYVPLFGLVIHVNNREMTVIWNKINESNETNRYGMSQLRASALMIEKLIIDSLNHSTISRLRWTE